MLKIRIAIPFAGLALTACGQSEAGRPNVIYVFPDQYRNSSLGFWSDPEFAAEVGWKGDPVATPNLDRFAREATVLTEAVSNFPVSSPHRGMLLSGMYPERNGVVLNCMSERPESSLREDAECIGDVFSAAGYDCAYIGKLHADFPTKNNPQRPGTYVSNAVPEWDAYTPPERRHGFTTGTPTAPTTCTSIPITGIPTATVTMSTSGRRGTKFRKPSNISKTRAACAIPKNRS